MPETTLETLLKDPQFRRKYAVEKACMDVAQIFADVMAERGWSNADLAKHLRVNEWTVQQFLSKGMDYGISLVAELLNELDMDLVVTARARKGARNG